MRVREKKEYVIFTFHTTAAAMATEKLCQERNIPGRLIPAPRSITADCGIAWAAPPEERERIENEPGLPEIARVYLPELYKESAMQTLNLKHLEAFCAVVERGSFTAAAETLYLAQSTVSGHILALEKDIGVPLLVRSGKRRITLTEEGRRVYDHAHTILQSCAELSRELEEQTSREVSLAASSIPMQYILPQLISDFHRENPDFRFLLRSGDSAAVHAAVLQGETHIGFVGAVLNTRELTYDCIATDPLVLVTPDTPRYRAMFDAGESGNALLGEPLIFREGGSGTQLAGQKFFTENGIDSGALNIVARIDNSEAVLRAVACGLGCAVVSGLAAGATKELLSFPLVGKNNEREIYMIRSRDRRPTKSARAFIDFLLDRRTLH